MPDLCCTKCGYDLRGLDFVDNRERCPECGRIIDLDFLAHDLVRQKRAKRLAERELTAAISLMLLTMLSSLATGRTGDVATFLTSPATIVLAALFLVLFTIVTVVRRLYW